MTWNEVRDRIADGFDTVLVPTGGVEQNGFHLVTGKHDTIVAHTVVRIAEEVGHALVAPVIPLSPEGE
jgi:creatinine amidohydrolase